MDIFHGPFSVLTFLARSSDLHAIITLAPIMAIHFDVSYPIPVFPPVTRTTRSVVRGTVKSDGVPPMVVLGLTKCLSHS